MCNHCTPKQSQPVQQVSKIPLGVGKTIESPVLSFNEWQAYIRKQVRNFKK